MIRKLNTENKWIAMALGTVFLFIMFLAFHVTTFYHDTLGYWTMSGEFVFQNPFATIEGLNEASDYINTLFSLRGYVLAYLLACIRMLGLDTWVGYWFFLSVFNSVLFTYIIPEVIRVGFGRKIKLIPRLVFMLLVMFFWYGLFVYPASENFALFCSTLTLLLMLKLSKVDTKSVGFKTVPLLLAYGFAIGFLLYAAYNIRSSYVYNIWIACVFLVALIIRAKKKMGYFLMASALIVGMAVCAAPQSVINHEIYGVYTPKTPIQISSEFSQTSFLFHEGLRFPRYETVVNLHADFPVMLSTESIGKTILELEGILEYTEELTTIDFIKVAFKYPLEFLGVYTGHFINGMDSRYGEIYVDTISSDRFLRVLINYILWFTCFLGVIVELNKQRGDTAVEIVAARRKLKSTEIKNFRLYIRRYGFLIFFVALPSLVSTFAHVEPRYYYALYILVFAYLAFLCDYRRLFAFVKDKLITIILLFVFLFGALNCVWNWTLSNTNFGSQVIERQHTYEISDTIFTLAQTELSSSNAQLAVMQAPIDLEPDTWYRLEFDMKIQDIDSLSTLYFDLYGADYDSGRQDISYAFQTGMHHYSADFNTDEIPPDAAFRTVYSTTVDYTLHDFTLSKLRVVY